VRQWYFLLEAHQLLQPQEKRSFAFEFFPEWLTPSKKVEQNENLKTANPDNVSSITEIHPERFSNLHRLKNTEAELIPLNQNKITALRPQTLFKKYLGYDIDSKMIIAAQKNARDINATDKIKFEVKDLFSDVNIPPHGKVWIVLNPPYGERAQIDENPKVFYQKAFEILEEVYKPDRVGVIIPKKHFHEKIFPESWQIKNKVPVSNGGIQTYFIVLARDDEELVA